MNYDFACFQLSQIAQYIAFFPSREIRETCETCTDIFARSDSLFPQNSRGKNCKTRLAVNPTHNISLLLPKMTLAGIFTRIKRKIVKFFIFTLLSLFSRFSCSLKLVPHFCETWKSFCSQFCKFSRNELSSNTNLTT